MAFFLVGCRSKKYTPTYNMHVGKNVMMRYDPAAQKVVISAESSGSDTYAKLKFSPPRHRLKSFSVKEEVVRACVSKTPLGAAVTKSIDQWIDSLALEKGDTEVHVSPKTLEFKVSSEVDNADSDIPISVNLTQERSEWIISILLRETKPLNTPKPKPLATVIIDRNGRTEGIKNWRSDINQLVGEIMKTRNVLMSCILSASR
jgi:hypothetical protein